MDTSNVTKDSIRRRFIASLGNVWTILGISILSITILEVSLTFYYDKADSIEIQRRFKSITDSGVYTNADWAEEYFKGLVDVVTAMRWAPYTHRRDAGHEGNYITIDEGGIRRTWNVADHDGTNTGIRISFFGGSTLWGYGSRDDFTIPSLVSKKLAKNGIRAEVTNHAVIADVSTQSLIRFVLELREGNAPDLVIFYGGLVDAISACLQQTPGTPLGNSDLERIFSQTTPRARLKLMIADYTKENLGLMRLSRDITGSFRGRPSPNGKGCAKNDLDALSEESLNVYWGNVRFIETISESFSLETLFYLEPQLSDKTHRTEYENSKLAESEILIPGRNDLYVRTRNKLLKREHELGRSPIHDLHAVFSDVTSQVYIDEGHYGEDGNERISEKIVTDILALHSAMK